MPTLSEFGADWHDISALLEEALAIPAEAHDAWLETLVGARARHRLTLSQLLANRARVESEDFLGPGPRLPGGMLTEPPADLGRGGRTRI